MTSDDDFPATSPAEITSGMKAVAWLLPAIPVGLGVVLFLAAFARDLLADTGWFG